MKRPPPAELREIMSLLPAHWTLASLDLWSMGWVAVLQSEERKFQLISDRGYIDAYEFIDGNPVQILPRADQRLVITSQQVCDLISNKTP